jgi:hypothetical protein
MLINIMGFNLSWFGLVLLGNDFIPVTLCWLIYHVYQIARTEKSKKQNLENKSTLSLSWRTEVVLISLVSATGILVDSVLTLSGIFQFPEHHIIPLWLVMLWASFAATIAHSLQFLAKSKRLQLLIGFVFPPFSYLAGASFLVVELPYGPFITYFVLAPIWSILMLLFYQCWTFIKRKGDNYVN